MTPDFALNAVKAVAGWVGSIWTARQHGTDEKDQHIDAALTSLMVAALETRHYIAVVMKEPDRSDLNKELELAKLWSKAGIDMSHVDSQIAGVYLLKADYWADTRSWTDAQKDDTLIELDQVIRVGHEALLK
jgi:hypothetical protein